MRVCSIRDSRLLIESRRKFSGMGLIGTKAGMTTWHFPSGKAVPCTVIAIEEGNIVTQIKNHEVDGYNAIQIGYMPVKKKKNNKTRARPFDESRFSRSPTYRRIQNR